MNSTNQIIITVDTEEEGLWGGGYSLTGNTTENLRGLPRFQAACEEISAPPTYLIDAPVLDDTKATDLMRQWQQGNRCEIGAHCHPWCNPPLDFAPSSGEETYLCNLPVELQFEKLNWLTNRISQVMEQAPTSYRSGRYGFDQKTAAILDDLGYRVDSSVLPLFDYRGDGGPDFRMAQREPYLLFKGHSNRKLIELPVTSGFTQSGYEGQRNLWLTLRKQRWRKFRLAGIADRLGFARRVKLSPEKYSKKDLQHLIDSSVSDGLSTLVLMLHSSSLAAGLSPYVTSESELDTFYQKMVATIQYAVSQYGFRAVTLTQSTASLPPST